MHARRRFLAMLAVLAPVLAVLPARLLRADYRLVNGWICKSTDLRG